MNAEQHTLWMQTVLTITATGPQRRAFIDGYNGAAIAPHASAAMRERHALGQRVFEQLRSQSS